jgi:hypothetical protein
MAQISIAQLQVENPDKLPFPHDEALIAYRVARQRVIEELAPKEKTTSEFEITLRLGCKDPVAGDEYYATPETGDISNLRQSAVICLTEWSLSKFTYGVIRLTERRLIPANRYKVLLTDSLRRIALMAPVSVTDFQKPAKTPRP